MKIRNGFVSNSSSSSFVVLGVLKNGSYEDFENLPKGIESLYIEGSKYDYVVGKVLADVGSDGDYLEEKGFSFGKLNEMAQEVATALDVDINEVKLLMGTRPS